MTEEEMAKEYAEKNKSIYGSDEYADITDYLSIKEAFLAGLKAGKDMAETDLATVAYMQGAERYKLKWHKVADGDLPNTEREVLVFMWGSYYLGYYKQYDGEDRSWHFEDFDEESEQVDAWCEIPKYTER